MPATALAKSVGVTSTTIAGYEAGRMRIPAPRLLDIADALGVSAAELIPPEAPAADPAARLLAAFGRIPDPGTREAVAVLVERLAEHASRDTAWTGSSEAQMARRVDHL